MVRKVHISIVLDRSGSMADCRDDAVAAVNGYLRQVRRDGTAETRLSVILFDSTSIDTIRDRVPVKACPELTLDEYAPRGGTPLLDAVGYSIGLLDCLSDKDERRIMAIMTDGLENASREYTRAKLKGLLDRKQKEDGWLIVYLGAGHDSWRQADQIGIRATHTADFRLSAPGEAAAVLHAVASRFASASHAATGQQTSALTADERARLLRPVAGRAGKNVSAP
jgi:uncharacterized protein YegL